jgi:type I restriction enzyme S subunit
MRAINSPEVRGKISALQSGSTRKRISRGNLANIAIPIPSINEQRRIVEKIETFFDEIDKGVESLQAAKNTLGLYRQSLLKSAFEGRLTADWRETNADKLEKPEALLARIRAERKTYYKAALEDWKEAFSVLDTNGEKSKKPPKPKPFKTETNYPLFAVISISNLPRSWGASKLVEVVDIFSGSTPKGIENCTGSGVPFFKVSDMNRAGNERTLNFARINASQEEAVSLGLHICPVGTVVFPKRGGAILTNKKRLLGQPSSFDLNVMGLVNRTETVLNGFLWYWMLSVDLSEIYDGSNVPQINNKNVEPLSFPICCPAEQVEIVRLLDEKLDAADALKAEIDEGLARAAALRQSILKKAFSGQLVSQDPEDEPASELLARIKVEKAEKERAAKRERKTTASRKSKTKVRRPTLTNLIEVLKKQNGWISASKAAQELGVFDGASSDDVEAFYRQLKEHLDDKDETIEVERRGDEDWLRLTKAEVS